MVSSSGSDTTALLLGRYRVEETLGEGSFGTVVRAFDARLKRVVAIKTLKRSLASADIGQFRAIEERFAREAEAGSRMGIHPNLVTVHDLVIEPDHTQYLILEYVRGGTLGERARGALPLQNALRITADVARGLQAAHDVGIVHRDIKPANIFIAADGRAQVGDFGIAQIDDVSGRTHATVGHPGTPLYMSPEQAQTTGYVRPASDQYSLGLVLFEMLTGQAYKRVGERAAAALLDAQPAAVANLIEDMLAPNPDDRLPSCEHVIRRIQAVARQQGLTETQLAVEKSDVEARRAVAGTPGAPVDPGARSDPSGALPLGSVLPVALSTDGAQGNSGAGIVPQAQASGLRTEVATGPVGQAGTPGVGTTGTGFIPPAVAAGGGSVADVGGPRSRRGPIIAGVAAAAIIAIATVALLILRGGPSTPPVTATAPPAATAIPTAAVLPTATIAPTLAPTASPTTPPTVAPTPTATPRATVAPTSAPLTLAIFSAGTTDQQLDTVRGEDVVTQFTVGKEVFGFVNFGGARANTDVIDVTLAENGSPQPSQHLTLPKTDGFLVFSLGKLGIGDYQLIIGYKGGVAKTADFRVNAAPVVRPTAVPVRPSTGGTGGTTSQPTAAPVATTAPVAATAPVATTAPKPVIPPTQAPLKPGP